VLIRVDFNVPMKDGIIQDDNRIKESLKTINYALEKNAKVILLSHLGRVKEESDLKKNDLSSVAIRLEELLHRKVTFVNATRGKEVEEVVNSMQNGDVVLLQNTRYEDLDGKKESSNNEELGAYWASLGDIFINDAFGTSHRAHASNVGIASHLPNGIGFLVEKEVNSLSIAIEKPPHPYTVILGGAKVSDKVGVIESLAAKADYILIGGAMAYTFLNAKEYDIGASYVDLESIDFAKKMLSLYAEKIILPVDSVNAKEIKEDANTTITKIENIESDDIGLDIGPDTVKLFSNYLEKSKLIVWNGTVGYSELEIFSHGTKGLLETLKNLDCTKVIGGGDTAAAVIQFGYKEYMTHISTGGGASLELLEGKELPGIAIIGEHDE
jgi:phosphoglycerate kinase